MSASLGLAASATPAPERAAGRRALAKRGRALSDGSFPVPDGAYWDKARQAIGRVESPEKRAKVAKLLRKTAPQVGRSAALKQSWAAPGGASMANSGPGISLAARAMLDNGQMMTCPECGHVAPAGDFGASGASLEKKPDILRTPARTDVRSRAGFAPGSSGIQPRSGSAAHALANTRSAVELAAGTLTARRIPIQDAVDVGVRRTENGAVLYHRRGGGDIASIRKTDDGRWIASIAGKDLQPHDHQRAALMEAVGTWNKGLSGARQVTPPLQPPPTQTPLMAEYGIPAMRSAAFATPMTSSGSGPRMTTAGRYDPDHDGDDDASPSGDKDKDYAGALSPKGRAIYKRLCARGMSPARALAFAKRAEGMKTARAA